MILGMSSFLLWPSNYHHALATSKKIHPAQTIFQGLFLAVEIISGGRNKERWPQRRLLKVLSLLLLLLCSWLCPPDAL